MCQYIVDDDAKCQQTLFPCLAIRTIDGLLGILLVEIKSLLAYKLIFNALYFRLAYLLHQSFMDDLVT